MLWLTGRLGGKRQPAALLVGILAMAALIPVLVLAREVQLPAGERQTVAGRVEKVAPLPERLRLQPRTETEPQRQLRERQRASRVTEPARHAQAVTAGARADVPARGWLAPADWELLARAVHAEARGESLEGQVAVAAVILNRRDDPRFPDRIADIIYQPGAFEAVADGQINLTPDATAYRAVALALKGWDPTNGALYYWNPARTTNRWIWSRPVLRVIGQHWFAR